MRWCLSPFLLLFAAIFLIPLRESMEEHRQIGVIVSSLLIILCISGFLALWGVPLVGRIASGIVSLGFGWYLVDECIINFEGDWGFGKSRSETTPLNSIFGFLVFGLPCMIYAIFGRFTLRMESDTEGDFDEPGHEDFDDDEPDQTNQDSSNCR